MDYIKEIAEAMSANHAAVMIGAGFSKNADKISSTDKWFKNWNELSDMFYETVYGNAGPGKEYNSSLRLAQEVEITVGRPKLENILKEAVPFSVNSSKFSNICLSGVDGLSFASVRKSLIICSSASV